MSHVQLIWSFLCFLFLLVFRSFYNDPISTKKDILSKPVLPLFQPRAVRSSR